MKERDSGGELYLSWETLLSLAGRVLQNCSKAVFISWVVDYIQDAKLGNLDKFHP